MEQEKSCDCSCCGGLGGFGGFHSRKAIVVALGLLSIFLFTKAISEIKGWGLIGKDIPPQATILSSGKGEVVVKPDIATFSFGIEEESLVVAEAQDKVAKSENDILVFLKKSGVSVDDIKVSGYNIYPRYEYPKVNSVYGYGGQPRVLVGYVVSETVEVKVRKLGDAGKIIGQLGELGATNLSGLSFSIDKEKEVIKEAREKAIADARSNAKRLASDLGVSLVRIVSFAENGNYPPPIFYSKAQSLGVASVDRATPELPSGTNKITSEVSITYEIR